MVPILCCGDVTREARNELALFRCAAACERDPLLKGREKALLSGSINEKMAVNDVSTGFASETFDMITCPCSKAGILPIGYPLSRCGTGSYACTLIWPLATDGVVTPGSRPHHTEKQHVCCWHDWLKHRCRHRQSQHVQTSH